MENQQTDNYVEMLCAYAAANPHEMCRPATTREVSKDLGLPTPEALQKLRNRNKKLGLPVPPGFAFMPGLGWRYRSRLEVLIWAHEYHRERSLDPGMGEAA